MFVANHFTRSETFFVPYIIYKETAKQSRTLADSKLYFGLLGKFLNSVGAISTKNDKRNNIILGDLIKGSHNWIIYPEGSMVKNKLIIRKNLFISNTPARTGPVRTGSSVLALKSQLLRQDFIEAYHQNDREILDEFKSNYVIYNQHPNIQEYSNVFSSIKSALSGLNKDLFILTNDVEQDISQLNTQNEQLTIELDDLKKMNEQLKKASQNALKIK
jgi:hypothetical protein